MVHFVVSQRVKKCFIFSSELPICANRRLSTNWQTSDQARFKKLKLVRRVVGLSRSLNFLQMSTWSRSALKLPSVVMSDKSFPTLGNGSSGGPPPSKKPVLSFAQKVKEKAEADAAAAEAISALLISMMNLCEFL